MSISRAIPVAFAALLGAGACSDDSTAADDASDDSADDADDDADDSDAPDSDSDDVDSDGPAVQDVPTRPSELRQYLADQLYLGFAAESESHRSVGAHVSPVRVFINDELADSLDKGNPQHPAGAAAIKELWGDNEDVPKGWAVMVKLADGEGGDSWYWYEQLAGEVLYEGAGRPVCVDCHQPGRDYFVTDYPLD